MITTLRIPTELKRRISKIAAAQERSAHSIMLEAITQHAARAEKYAAFMAEAEEASRHAHRGGRTYSVDEVRATLRLHRNRRPKRAR